jgi:hypothetical protein
MKNIFLYIVLLVGALFASCEDKRETLDMSGDVDVNIHSFSINGVEGIINPDNSTITLVLPNGTDLTALSPQIALGEGAEISPANGESIDFSQSIFNPTIYTVHNGDLYQKYKVSVDVARAKITKFRIGTTEGKIDDAAKTVTLYLPAGTDVTTLVPIMEYTDGATITPADGSAVDFTNPVQYKLNYAGSEFVYTVTVILGEEPLPAIVIFNGEDVSPQWTGIAGNVDSPFANPQKDGINTTAYCASILRAGEDTDNGGKAWSGGALWNSYKVNIDPAKYGSFSLMVLKEVAGDVQLEIQSDGEQNKDWLKVWYSDDNLGKWQKLTFTIPEGRTAVINNILAAPHCHDAGQPVSFGTQRMYWDELIAIPK